MAKNPLFNQITAKIVEEENAIPYEVIHDLKSFKLKLTGTANCVFMIGAGNEPIYTAKSIKLPSISLTNIAKTQCKCNILEELNPTEVLFIEYGDSDVHTTVAIANATGIHLDIRVSAATIIFYITPTYDRFILSDIVDYLKNIDLPSDNNYTNDAKAVIQIPHYVEGVAPWAFESCTIFGWHVRGGKIYLDCANTEATPLRVKYYTMKQLFFEMCEAAKEDPKILYYEFAFTLYTVDETANNNIVVQTAIKHPCIHGTEIQKVNLIISDDAKSTPYFILA